jgi:phosphatidylglycerophosphate synthase
MLTAQKDFFNRLFSGIGRTVARLPIHPNLLTLLGLFLIVCCCGYLLLTKNLLLFSILALAAGLFDLLDGAVARASGKMSKFGSYLDAMTDRYVEVFVVISVAWVTGYWFLSSLCILGLYSVSYAKARAGMEIPIRNNEWPDFLERTERDVIYLIGIAVSQIFPVRLLGHDLFWWVLLFLAVGTNATVLQRILRARRLIAEREKPSASQQ